MDLSFVESLIPNIAAWLNLDPATVLLLVLLVSVAANVAARLIPDTADGWLGEVRKICKVLGVYAQNRVAPGVKTADVVKQVVGQRVNEEVRDTIHEMASEADALIPEVVHPTVKDPFGQAAERLLRDLSEEEGK